jgi:lipid A oxidase
LIAPAGILKVRAMDRYRAGVAAAALAALTLAGSGAKAELAFSAYGGYSASHHSNASVTGTGADWKTGIFWDGASFEMPPYYGLRATWWLDRFDQPNLGIALDFNHNKVVAKNRPPGVSVLEFTDGINYVTLNALYRFPNATRFTPYAGAGFGLSIPHVEYQAAGPKTFEYQVTGPVIAGLAGVDAKINDYISVFTEYRMTYSWNNASLNGGGRLDADILTHHFMAGVTVKFDWY